MSVEQLLTTLLVVENEVDITKATDESVFAERMKQLAELDFIFGLARVKQDLEIGIRHMPFEGNVSRV